MTEFLHLASSDHLSFLHNFLSSSFPHPSDVSDVKLCARNGSISVNRLVLALLHPELASCPRLTLEIDIAVIFPDLELAELRERVEAVLRGEWGKVDSTSTHQIPIQYHPPPVKCELELEFIDVKNEEPEGEEFVEGDVEFVEGDEVFVEGVEEFVEEKGEDIKPKDKRRKYASRKEKYHHSDEKSHVCPHCGSEFKSEVNLRIHIRKHTGDKPYTCNQCAYATADPSNFKKHQKCHLAKFN